MKLPSKSFPLSNRDFVEVDCANEERRWLRACLGASKDRDADSGSQTGNTTYSPVASANAFLDQT